MPVRTGTVIEAMIADSINEPASELQRMLSACYPAFYGVTDRPRANNIKWRRIAVDIYET